MVEHDADSPTHQTFRTQGPKQQEHPHGLSINLLNSARRLQLKAYSYTAVQLYKYE